MFSTDNLNLRNLNKSTTVKNNLVLQVFIIFWRRVHFYNVAIIFNNHNIIYFILTTGISFWQIVLNQARGDNVAFALNTHYEI